MNGPKTAIPTMVKKRPEPNSAILWRRKRRHANCHWLSETRATSKSDGMPTSNGSGAESGFTRALVVLDAGIDHRIHDVGKQVGHDHEGRSDQKDTHQHRIVRVAERFDQLSAHTRPGEDRLRHDRAAEQDG